MKAFCLAWLGAALLLLPACQTPAYKAAESIEGTYVRADNPGIMLEIQKGHYRQGSEALFTDGAYTARQLAEDKYELKISYQGRFAGNEGTVIIRKVGEYLFAQDDNEGPETVYQKK